MINLGEYCIMLYYCSRDNGVLVFGNEETLFNNPTSFRCSVRALVSTNTPSN